VKISVFGLGYVGTVTSVCLVKQGHSVIGVDPNDFKVESISRGVSPIVEPGVDELLKQAIKSGRLQATADIVQAVLNTELSLVCVGTPSSANGSLNLESVMRVAEQIGEVLRKKDTYHGVVIRSTVLPGTVETVAARIEEAAGKKQGVGFGVASNPEFLREGTSVHDFENPPYTVVGASDTKMVALLSQVYSGISAPLFTVAIREAELLKYACNAFHAVKVAFANEVGSLSKKFGIDSHAVMRMFCADTKLNISPAYLKPGFAFGGSCLPKDLRAITHEAKKLDVATPLLDSLLPSNELQIKRVVDWVIAQRKKKIGVLGLSFKHDTDDLRESPIVRLVEILLGKGYSIAIYDSNVRLSRLIGANRSYIEEEIPHISLLLKERIDEVLTHAEVVVVANKSAEFAEVVPKMSKGVPVLDLVRISEESDRFPRGYEGIAW
jgi:GDP-mannose 6-dehydrogenase